jgi:hypothetical protein
VTGPGGWTGLIGRVAELEALTDRMLAAQSGAGGFVLVSGEAGIGKTRLLGEVARWGRGRGMTVLLGRSVAGGGPYRPIAEALVGAMSPGLAEDGRLAPYRSVLGRLIPGWAGVVDPDHSLVDPVVVLGEAVLEALGVIAESNGAVVLLDDLHWADPDSLALVNYLIGRVEDRPVLLIGAARDEERAAPALGELPGAPSCSSVKLPRLSAAEVAALARTRAGGLADDSLELVVRGADGLPLLVEEMVDALAAGASPGVPHTLAALTRRRMNKLSASAREVVHTAAVLGSDVDWRLLPAASGRSDDDVAGALREAVDASLLVLDASAGGSLRWRHALTRDAVLAQLLPPERAIIASRAAAALDTGNLPGERLSLVARLYAQCGRGGDAARMLLAVARTAVDAGGLGSAEDALRRARRLAPR